MSGREAKGGNLFLCEFCILFLQASVILSTGGGGGGGVRGKGRRA